MRWMKAARQALESAKADLSRGDYNWACFKAEQAAECALKGLLRGLGASHHTQSLTRLLISLPKDLDPDTWIEGAPSNYYTGQNARIDISYATVIIKRVEDQWNSFKMRQQ